MGSPHHWIKPILAPVIDENQRNVGILGVVDRPEDYDGECVSY